MKNKILLKSSLIGFVVTCLLSLLFISCNNKKNNAAPTMADLSIVPYDASVVLHMNLKSIWEKGELDNADDVAFIKLLKQELRDEGQAGAKIINGLIDNPNSCGLNLKGDIFVFTSESMKADVCFGFTMKDSDQFNNFLKDLEQSANINISISYNSESNYNTAFSEEINVGFCWDNKKAYFFPVFIDDQSNRPINVARDYSSRLMSFQEYESMVQNDNFNKFMLGGHDLGFYFDYEAISEEINKDLGKKERELYESMTQSYKNSAVCYTLNFETGVVRMQGAILGAEGKNEFFTGDFNPNLVNYLPKEALAAATLSINMDHYINLMEKAGSSSDLHTKVYNDYTTKDILQSFSGDIALSLTLETQKHSYYEREESFESLLPVFTVVAELNNSRVLKNILDDAKEQGGITASDNGYEIQLDDMDIFVKISDNVLMVSNDNLAIAAFSRGGNSNGLGKVAAKAKKGNYVYWNMNMADYSPSVKEAFVVDPAILRLIEGYFKDAEVIYDRDNQTLDLVLNIKNNDKNSLKYTIDYIDDNLLTLERLTQ